MTAAIRTTINGRWDLLLPEHRAARPEWVTGWEPERLDAMAAVLGPGDVIYDIGAEEGDLPALCASWGADVVLVEPNPRVWPNMRFIFDANGLPIPLACYVGFACEAGQERGPGEEWPERQSLHVRSWPECAYGPIIGDHGFLVLPERPDCPAVTLSQLADILDTEQIAPPTAITMDVEGAELTVLRGAQRLLELHRPIVWVSVHIDLPWVDEKFPGDTGEKVAEYMTSLGYEGRHLATDHEEHWEWRHPEGR